MPTIFVSHAARDAAIANKFKLDIEQNFLGLCTLFVSSNLDSIPAGDEWARRIKSALSECSILIGLLSPTAVQRPWIYFEFGAGWMRDIPVIPICHSGLSREQLAAPLSSFQALNLTNPVHMSHVYQKIADAIGCAVPRANMDEIAGEYFSLTEASRKRDVLNSWTQQLLVWNPELATVFSGNIQNTDALVPANLEAPFFEFLQMAIAEQYLAIEPAGMAIGTRVGAQASVFRVSKGVRFDQVKAWLAS